MAPVAAICNLERQTVVSVHGSSLGTVVGTVVGAHGFSLG